VPKSKSKSNTKKWWVMIAVALMLLVINLDMNIVNLAVPTIARGMHASLSQMQWVLAAYITMAATFFLVGGRVSDRVGKRSVFFVGAAMFAVGSLVCALASDIGFLIAGRFVQGIGFGVAFPVLITIACSAFPKNKMPYVVGLLAAASGVFQAVGPTIGGMILDGYSWQWVFWINVPICVLSVGILAVAFTEKEIKSKKQQPFDVVGAVLYIVGASAVVYGIIDLGKAHYSWWMVVAWVVGIASLVGLWRFEKTHKDPFFDASLFKVKNYSAVLWIRVLCQYVGFALLFMLPLYLQGPLNYSSLDAGLWMMLVMLCFGALSAFSGRYLLPRYGAKAMINFGTLLFFVSCIAFVGETHFAGDLFLTIGLLALGLGFGLQVTTTTTLALSSVPHKKMGSASGLYFSIAMLGSTVAVAVSGSILNGVSSSVLKHLLSGIQFGKQAQAYLTSTAQGLHPLSALNDFFAPPWGSKLTVFTYEAFVTGFIVVMAVNLLMLLAMFVISRRKLA
jgi:EmrB/QacA subfamily drug resistance transporter